MCNACYTLHPVQRTTGAASRCAVVPSRMFEYMLLFLLHMKAEQVSLIISSLFMQSENGIRALQWNFFFLVGIFAAVGHIARLLLHLPLAICHATSGHTP